MDTGKASETHSITWEGWEYRFDRHTLTMLREDRQMAQLPLAPKVDGTDSELGLWSREADDAYRAPVAILGSNGGKRDSTPIGSARLAVRDGHVAFWIETPVVEFETFSYFPETTFQGERWQSYVSDGWDRLWDRDLDTEVGISSAYLDIMNVFGADGAGLTDPGDNPPTFVWNMPARVFSIETECGFIGFSIPGALPVGVVRLTMKDRLLSVNFDALRPGCAEGGMPVVYFVPGLQDPYDLLDEHRHISDRLGITRKKSADHPAWWTEPVFKAYLEHTRRNKETTDREAQKEILNTQSLLEWISEVKLSLRREEMLVIVEQGAYRCYGDYTPIDALGGATGFRKTVDDLRTQGVRVCYYVHPFMFNRKVEFYREHPEAFCKPKDDSVMVTYACENYDAEPQYALVDWTHPLGREYVLSQVELILSEKEGCLNCDWLRSNHWRSPDPRFFTFHDPDWGIGDLMSRNVQRLLYQKAKQVKPDACVSKVSFADPYMQPYADVNLLSEEWNGWTKTWYERGRIASRTIRDTVFVTDPYFLTITKSYEYYMAMMVWNILETPDVHHAIHPYVYFRELRLKEYRRRLSGCKVQENAPLNITDIVRVEPAATRFQEPTMWRKRTTGRLAGWYAALALGRRACITYSETEARIGTTETRLIRVPLPAWANLTATEAVLHDGKVKPWPARRFTSNGEPWVELKIEDCAGEVLYYRLRY